jgi:spore germination protein YaaH
VGALSRVHESLAFRHNAMNKFQHRLVALIATAVVVACGAPSGNTPAEITTATGASAISPGDLTHPWVMDQTSNGDATAGGSIQPLYGAVSSAAGPATLLSATTARPKREVFAFAFGNASLGDPTYGYPAWNFNLLSTIAYFGLTIAWDGTIVTSGSGWSTWNSPALPAMVSTAHAHGVRVILSINLHEFNTNPGGSLCTALYPTRRTTTINAIAAQISKMHLDGVNIDYEGTNHNCAYHYSLQDAMTALTAEFRAKMPKAYIAIDTYSGSAHDNSGFFNIAALTPYVDSFFVMAYDMEYYNWGHAPLSCSSMCLGPTAPLTTYYYNDTLAMSQYAAVAGASKTILGIPYYGRKGCVAGVTPSNAPPNARPVSGSVAADGYLDSSTENGYGYNSDYHIHRETHDLMGAVRWDTWTSSTAKCTREMYWDDVVSLERKYDLVNQKALRGVGIFALQYGGGAPELWSALFTKFMGCTGSTVTQAPDASLPPGAAITFSAVAGGCTKPLYRFYVQYPNGTWSLKRNWSSNPTFTWATAGAPLGNYTMRVWTNQSGDPLSTWESYGEQTFTLGAVPHCATAGLTPGTSTQEVGTTVSFTATSTGCGTPTYEYWVQAPNGTWTMKRGFSFDPTWTWNPAGLVAGTYTVHVWANQYGYPNARLEAFGSSTITFTGCASAALAPATLATSPGATVGFTATSVGCGAPLYQFWVKYPNGTWSLKRKWAAGATFNWSTTGLANGTYTVIVAANQQGGSLAAAQALATSTVTLATCKSATLAPASGSVKVGTAVGFTAGSTGCSNAVYEYWLKDAVGLWHLMRGFGAPTWTWNNPGWGKGHYTIVVWAIQQGAPTSRPQAYTTSSFTLT